MFGSGRSRDAGLPGSDTAPSMQHETPPPAISPACDVWKRIMAEVPAATVLPVDEDERIRRMIELGEQEDDEPLDPFEDPY